MPKASDVPNYSKTAMKTTLYSPATRLALPVAGLLFLVLLTAAPITRAVTISATLAMADESSWPQSAWPRTQTNPVIGTFDFGAAAANSLPVFGGFALTIGFGGLDTDIPTGSDFNHLSVCLGYGAFMYDTGIKLNGFTNEEDTLTIFGNPDLAGNASSILRALKENNGQLKMQIRDSTALPSNPFYFIGGTATMYAGEHPIPFDPAQTLGFGVLAAFLAFRRFPQLKRFFARA